MSLPKHSWLRWCNRLRRRSTLTLGHLQETFLCTCRADGYNQIVSERGPTGGGTGARSWVVTAGGKRMAYTGKHSEGGAEHASAGSAQMRPVDQSQLDF